MSEHGMFFIVFERPEGSLTWTIAHKANDCPMVHSNETAARESAAIVETRSGANGKPMRAHVATVQLPWTGMMSRQEVSMVERMAAIWDTPAPQLPDMTYEEAEKLWEATDYACEATHQDENPINSGDATAFFLEGYLYARKRLKATQ